MPMPGWWRHLNKQFFNPRAINGNKWDVLTHVGRSSGKRYQTPMEAIPVNGGFVVFLVYGRNTDWAKNVLVAQSGVLLKDGKPYELSNPRIVDLAEVEDELPENASRPPALLRVNDLLRVDIVDSGMPRQ